MNIISKIYDNTKDGVPNYSFDMEDGRRLYYSGVQMNPMPVTGDAINFTIIATKTSANGNQYTTIKDVEVIKNPDGHNDAPQQLSNVVQNVAPTPSEPEPESELSEYNNCVDGNNVHISIEAEQDGMMVGYLAWGIINPYSYEIYYQIL